MIRHGHTQMALLPYHFFLFEIFRLESRGHHNDLGILFLELVPEALYQLWRETFSLLCSKVYWSCHLKSLPIKDGAQIRVVREHLPNIYSTFTRKPQHMCSCLLTRIWRFFQIHSVFWPRQLAYACLKYGRTSIDNCHGALTAMISTFNHFPDFRPCWILLGSSCQ